MLALTDAAVEPRLLGRGRIIGGLVAIAGAVPLFSVSATTSTPATAAATSEMTAIFLVIAVGFLGPSSRITWRAALAPLFGRSHRSAGSSLRRTSPPPPDGSLRRAHRSC